MKQPSWWPEFTRESYRDYDDTRDPGAAEQYGRESASDAIWEEVSLKLEASILEMCYECRRGYPAWWDESCSNWCHEEAPGPEEGSVWFCPAGPIYDLLEKTHKAP